MINKNYSWIYVGLYIFSGCIFGMFPVFEFRKKGGIKIIELLSLIPYERK